MTDKDFRDYCLRTADADFCLNTIKEARQRNDKETEIAYTQRLMQLQMEEMNRGYN